ncbi:hypothetical protein [Propionivibrio dicarboxylicus]|uniref:Uncharacterized protein n=1 Tax=Propionivibrio dicarboxylicus TaxID=83767 RepID=A0A1G8EKP1_9RHOO|nr:hypothetical protein [Propionivibrio dicarboxylicus]SDH70362.1 hypothetical protein SAMN05660652_02111 [Propionivibrio dicarboxylicus]
MRTEDLPHGISAIRDLPHHDFHPMLGSIIAAKANKELQPSQAFSNFALRPKLSPYDHVSQRLPHVGWSASICGLQEFFHG